MIIGFAWGRCRKKTSKLKGKQETPFAAEVSSIDVDKNEACLKPSEPSVEMYLEKTLGFKVTPRTLIYIERRLDEVGFAEKQHEILHRRIEIRSIIYYERRSE